MTFNQWLKAQVFRDDPVGDLARDAAMDDRPKPRKNKLTTWHAFLGSAGACSAAHDALDEAWEAYEASK